MYTCIIYHIFLMFLDVSTSTSLKTTKNLRISSLEHPPPKEKGRQTSTCCTFFKIPSPPPTFVGHQAPLQDFQLPTIGEPLVNSLPVVWGVVDLVFFFWCSFFSKRKSVGLNLYNLTHTHTHKKKTSFHWRRFLVFHIFVSRFFFSHLRDTEMVYK